MEAEQFPTESDLREIASLALLFERDMPLEEAIKSAAMVVAASHAWGLSKPPQEGEGLDHA